MEQGRTIISTDLFDNGGPSALDQALDEAAEVAPSETETRAFVFSASHHGLRLDRAISELVPEFSRSYLQQLIETGAVRVNAHTVNKPAAKVKAGERGEVELRPTPQSQAFRPENIAIDVVFEDDHLLVVNKPAGLVVHPAAGNWSGTLLNALLGRHAQAATLPRAGIVHRLDKDTSGLMVVARTRPAMDRLVWMIGAREVSRQYLALAHRPWAGSSVRHVDAPIGRDPRNRLRMAVIDPLIHAGKPAATDFELLENGQQGCWVKATLHTGRTHQIRVHMAHIGHPLVADVLYGGAPAAGMQRQALHAFCLAFRHPVTGEELKFESRLPQDLREALHAWGLRYNGPNESNGSRAMPPAAA